MPRDLDGVRILDLSRLVSGNTATIILADLGAEVIKVESPTGDSLRAWRREGIATHWKMLGRNKKSLDSICANRVRSTSSRQSLGKYRSWSRISAPGRSRRSVCRQKFCCRSIRNWSSCAFQAGGRRGRTAIAPVSERWSRACAASLQQMDSPIASRCCPLVPLPIQCRLHGRSSGISGAATRRGVRRIWAGDRSVPVQSTVHQPGTAGC